VLQERSNVTPQAQARNQPAETRSARPRRTEAVIVSSDDGFLIELGPVLGDAYRTRTVEQPSQIEGAVEGSRWLAIIDTASLTDVHTAVARLEQQHRSAPIIVVASNPDEWASAVARGNVIAVVAREQMAGKALIDALAAAALRLREEQPPQSPAPSHTSGGGSKTGKRLQGMPLAMPVAAVAAVLIAGSVWWLLHRPSAAPAAVAVVNEPAAATEAADSMAPAPAAAPAANSQTVVELLSAARAAFRDQKLLLPLPDADQHGDSALDLYSQVLAQQPSNEEALDGIKRLYGIGRARIQSDLSSGKLDDAARLAALFRGSGVDPDSMREIDASIAAARPKWLITRTQEYIAAGDFTNAEQLLSQMTAAGADQRSIIDLRRAIGAKQLDQQLLVMSGEVKAAIDSGSLLDPANDNARTRLQAMRAINRNHPATVAAQRELQAALLARALDATHKDQFDPAQRFVAAAGEIGANAEVTEAKRTLQSEIDLVAAGAAAAAAADAKAKQTAAAAAAHSVQNPESNNDLPAYISARPTKPLNASYPQSAVERAVQGSVTVEFTLSADGTASNATVVDAKPSGVFDRAAMKAVLGGHYDVSALNERKSVRARIRLTFKPS
jgi:TonB family protein